MQRFLDIFISGIALILLLPLLTPLIIVLRFTGEGEVFFKQVRVGFKGKKFEIYKFATMLKDSPNIGARTLTMQNDPRVLPIGKFLRKTKINELPQLLNIFIGNMSIVGPRPLVPDGEINYTSKQSKIIRSVTPGVTGIGSLVLRDEESFYAHREDAKDFYINVISPYKASLEIWYIENKSFLLNLKIILATILAVIYPTWDAADFFRTAPKISDKMIKSKLIK
ncbi:sugar transferase [Gammaproteobacteria bacterium]|nr:sugar transferase [Gammaproteobacteria bacterium]